MALFFMATNFIFSNEEYELNILKAENFKKEHKYTKAINHYIKAIKAENGNDEKIKFIYFDIADCFFKSGKKNMAIKVLKFSIYRYGAIKSDIIASTKLDKDFSKFVLGLIEDKYETYRNKYVTRSNKDLKIQNNTPYAVKPF